MKSIGVLGLMVTLVSACASKTDGNDGDVGANVTSSVPTTSSSGTTSATTTTDPTATMTMAGTATTTPMPSVTTTSTATPTATTPTNTGTGTATTTTTTVPPVVSTPDNPTPTASNPAASGSGTGDDPTAQGGGGGGNTPPVVSSGGAGGDMGMPMMPVDMGAEYFTDWPAGSDPATIGLKLAKLFNSQSSDGTRHYKEACAWYGSLQIAFLLNETDLLASLISRYDQYKGGYASLFATAGSVDENVWGIVPLEISMHDDDAVYLKDGQDIADHQQANIATQARMAIDDMFMITGLQMQAYRASGDEKYLNLGADTMVDYLTLQQDDGLFFQLTPNDSTKWSRGNGWFAAGMTEMLRELPADHADYAAIKAAYDKMMGGLLEYRIESGQGAGLWKQVLDYDGSENWAETSGSAMFTIALVTGVRRGWLDAATYGPVARDAWIALVGYLENDGRLRGVSDWMYGGTIAEYTARPTVTGDNHGQAPMLWSAAALLRP